MGEDPTSKYELPRSSDPKVHVPDISPVTKAKVEKQQFQQAQEDRRQIILDALGGPMTPIGGEQPEVATGSVGVESAVGPLGVDVGTGGVGVEKAVGPLGPKAATGGNLP